MIPPIATKEDYSKCLFLAVASSQPYILLSETTPAYKLEIYIYIGNGNAVYRVLENEVKFIYDKKYVNVNENNIITAIQKGTYIIICSSIVREDFSCTFLLKVI